MQQFQPLGFKQRAIETSLGVMAYYVPIAAPWINESSDEVGRRDRPPLVFLHSLGGGSSAYEWSKVYPAFAWEYPVFAPDLVGWGQSAHPIRDYSPDDYCQIIGEFLESITPSPAIVAATSLTAGITVRLAVQRPDLFQKLFLISPSGYGDFGVDYRQSLSAQLTAIPGVDRLLYTVGAANEFAVRNFLAQFLFASPLRISNEIVNAYLASALQRNAEYAALASLKGSICFDLARYLPQLQVPTMIVWGEKSRFNSPLVGRRLAQLNPAMVQRFETIANTGVLPHLECPAQVISCLKDWLRPESPSRSAH